ncbi:hypothetical protein Pfo_014047 [Paulownia fortunei]|nr:hypothetical protein Pfo_014047 [Paulownia fortunei]
MTGNPYNRCDEPINFNPTKRRRLNPIAGKIPLLHHRLSRYLYLLTPRCVSTDLCYFSYVTVPETSSIISLSGVLFFPFDRYLYSSS